MSTSILAIPPIFPGGIDGSYPVYATQKDGRIVKFEIDMAGEGQDEALRGR
jgi:hypothetical protein